MTPRILPTCARLAVFGLAALLPAAALAQTTSPAAGHVATRVDGVFADWDKPDSPGCALGVYRDGAIVYSRGYGMADLERRVPITPATVFDIGSTSKQFSAAAIVLLEQDGRLTLDDDVRKWIDELPDYGRPITIRHLLLHTSGLRDYIGLLTLAGHRIDDVTDAGDALRIIARQKELNFQPGAEHLYSNSGYFLLSAIVERASGKTLQAFARERIFRPLGMTKTHYLGSYDDIVPDRALAYAPRQGGGLRQDISRWLQVGDGAVFTTVEELLRWDNNFYDPKVGGKPLLETLQAPGRLASGTPLTYALGLGVGTYRGQRTVSHGGSWGGYRAELLRFPDQRFSVATLCNLGTINPTQLARQVADVYLEGVLAPVEAPEPGAPGESPPTDVLRSYVGLYRSPTTRARLTFGVANGRLTLTGDGRMELRSRSRHVFEAPGQSMTWTFEPDASGRPARVTRQQDGTREVFERVSPMTLSAAELAAYAGRYHSEELDAAFTLSAEDGALVLHRRGAGPQRLVPIARDEFMAGSVTVRVTRGSGNDVDGYVMDLGRVRNLRFERMR